MRSRQSGFTLVEIIVVTMMIGFIAAYAVTAYLKGGESTKADDAIGIVKAIAGANRMYALDHIGSFASGSITNTCNSGICDGTGNPAPACALLRCNYLNHRNWDLHPFVFEAADGKVPVPICAGGAIPSAKYTSCAKRRSGAAPGTDLNPYTDWGYAVDVNGVLTASGGAPTPAGL